MSKITHWNVGKISLSKFLRTHKKVKNIKSLLKIKSIQIIIASTDMQSECSEEISHGIRILCFKDEKEEVA